MCNYNIFHCDVSLCTSSHNRGEGVLIVVRKDIPSSLIHDQSIEQLFVNIWFESKHFIISAVHLPPSSLLCAYESYVNTVDTIILQCNPKISFILCGDYNFPKILCPKILVVYFILLLRLFISRAFL